VGAKVRPAREVERERIGTTVQAAERRSELSPRRGFASLGLTPLNLWSPEGATAMISKRRDSGDGLSIAPSGARSLRGRSPKARKASPWA